jgi:hypothetical protein
MPNCFLDTVFQGCSCLSRGAPRAQCTPMMSAENECGRRRRSRGFAGNQPQNEAVVEGFVLIWCATGMLLTTDAVPGSTFSILANLKHFVSKSFAEAKPRITLNQQPSSQPVLDGCPPFPGGSSARSLALCDPLFHVGSTGSSGRLESHWIFQASSAQILR